MLLWKMLYTNHLWNKPYMIVKFSCELTHRRCQWRVLEHDQPTRYSSKGSVVSVEKIKMWKVDKRWTTDILNTCI